MEFLPETLEETIRLLQDELDQQPDAPAEERRQVERILGWFRELEQLKTKDAPAMENAIDALQRIVDRTELGDSVSQGDRHYINRMKKLINNLAEVIELEAKKAKENA